MKFASVKRLLLVFALVAVVVGAVIAFVSASQARSFGWFAYAPLSGEVFTPSGAQFVSIPTIIGLVIMMLGLLAGAFLAGMVVGRRGPKD